MAAQLIMPTLPGDQPQSRHFLPNQHHRPHHARSHSYQVPQGLQISPLDTSAMPQHQACSTPPSPKRGRQHFRQGGQPMYMPAVLRPCHEFTSRKVTRCKTAGSTSSTDSDSTLRRANTAIMSIPGLSLFGRRLSRQSTGETGETGKTLDGEWKLDAFPEVTGQPTRMHWKPDPESTVCDDPTCKRTFNYFVRRHHCRKCGNIFCDWHSSAVLPLDQNGSFNPRAGPSRTCNHCFQEVKALVHTRNNSQSSSSTASDAMPPTPMNAPTAPGVTPPHKPEVAASVPRDWNWSTF
ncbi:Zn finger protein [Metarhizium acridum]|uniref:FYVE domain protein, putative n=1 Tax=Metarhizium acridum (strain CQMa 102) TaxID=655827 RepID=E9DZQ2_METAQ|nr:FYVE domain protein, putative [Metarhizium acridum CQMa 102]EFY90737.1 FYVE domain protein, putative [Metarhizium acridum CQMa 102]KAG8419920.1 Zn finger protein [Metarhizium acridum]